MAGQFSKGPTSYPSSLPEVSPSLFRYQRFWQRLIAYRPLLMLAGLWVTLLAIAFVAYEHLLYAEQDMPQDRSAASEVTVYPHQRSGDASSTDAATDTATPDNANGASSATSSAEAPAPTWDDNASQSSNSVTVAPTNAIGPGSLAAMVTTCAIGCFLLNRQLQAPPRPRRKSSKRLLKTTPLMPSQARPRKVAHAAAKQPIAKPIAQPSTPKQLVTYDPSQPLMPPPMPPSKAASAPSRPAQPQAAPANSTVVPADTQHSLDWPQDSLVNTADVRQRRSLSSFL